MVVFRWLALAGAVMILAVSATAASAATVTGMGPWSSHPGGAVIACENGSTYCRADMYEVTSLARYRLWTRLTVRPAPNAPAYCGIPESYGNADYSMCQHDPVAYRYNSATKKWTRLRFSDASMNSWWYHAPYGAATNGWSWIYRSASGWVAVQTKFLVGYPKVTSVLQYGTRVSCAAGTPVPGGTTGAGVCFYRWT